MDDQIPSASTPVFKIKTKSRQRSNKPYERPSQSWGGKIVDSVSSISDWLKNAASYLTNTQSEEEIDVNEQSVLSNSSSRSAIYTEMPSEIRDVSARPSLGILREEEEDAANEALAEVERAGASQAVPTAASTPCPPAVPSEEHRVAPVASFTGEAPSTLAPFNRDALPRSSHPVGLMNRLDIPEDNLKRLKSNLSKRNRHSLPCSNTSTSPPVKASRLETVDSSSTRVARNSDLFGLNSTLSSSFTYGPRSPFYDGRTSFGGSSSHRMSRLAFPYSMNTRKLAPILKVRASEMAKSDCGRSEALSCASLKILDVINKESSLLEDSKKIPLNDSSGLSNKAVFNNFVNSTRRVSSSKLTPRSSMPSHITTSLLNKSMGSVNQSVSNSSNLDWRLNPATFADDAHSPAPTSVSTISSASAVIQQPFLQKTSNHEANVVRERVGGKMKSSISGAFGNRASSKTTSNDEIVAVVNLPQVSLPPLKSLPSFNLDYKTSDPSTNDSNQFKFSWPSTKSESSREAVKVTISSSEAYTFSNPLADANGSQLDKVAVKPTNIPKNGAPPSPVTSDATWSCPKCIYKNSPQVNQCLACKTFRIGCTPSSSNFQAERRENVPLASSSSSSPTSSSSAPVTAVAASSALPTISSSSTSLSLSGASSWGDKFKKPPGSWTCDVCMVDNKPECNQCAACETPKPGAPSAPTSRSNPTLNNESTDVISSNTLSKKWTCDTCYVKNEENRDTCSSCEMSRKASETFSKQASYSGYKFNLTDKNPPPFKFGFSSTAVTAAAASSTVPSLASSILTGPQPIDETKAPRKDIVIETSVAGKSSNLSSPTVTPVFAFDAGKSNSLSSPIAPLAGPVTAVSITSTSSSSTTSISTSSTFGIINNENNTPAVTFRFGSTNGPNNSAVPAALSSTSSSSISAPSNLTLQPQQQPQQQQQQQPAPVKPSGFSFTASTPVNFSFGSSSTSTFPKFGVSATSNGSVAPSPGSFVFSASGVAANENKVARKDEASSSLPASLDSISKPQTFNPPNPSTFTFNSGSINNNSVAAFGVPSANGSTGPTVTPTVLGATVTTSNSTQQQTASKQLGFNFTPNTPLNFSFGNTGPGTVPKFGASSASNGSFASVGTGSFTFTGAAGVGTDAVRSGESTSGRPLRKAKRRLPTAK